LRINDFLVSLYTKCDKPFYIKFSPKKLIIPRNVMQKIVDSINTHAISVFIMDVNNSTKTIGYTVPGSVKLRGDTVTLSIEAHKCYTDTLNNGSFGLVISSPHPSDDVYEEDDKNIILTSISKETADSASIVCS